MFHRILVPLDGSQRAEQALPVAIRLAQAAQGTLVLVRAVPPLPILTPYPEAMAARQRAMEAESQEARTYLDQRYSCRNRGDRSVCCCCHPFRCAGTTD